MAGLAGVMNSPMPGEATMIRHGKTVHDVDLDSMASGFDPEAKEAAAEGARAGGQGTQGRQSEVRVLRELMQQTAGRQSGDASEADFKSTISQTPSIVRPASRSSQRNAARDRDAARLRQLGRELGADASSSGLGHGEGMSSLGVPPNSRQYLSVGEASADAEDEDQETRSVVDISGVTPSYGRELEGAGGRRPTSSNSRRKGEADDALGDLQEQTLKQQMEAFNHLKSENFNFRIILDNLREQLERMSNRETTDWVYENSELKAKLARAEKDKKRCDKMIKQSEAALKTTVAERDAAQRKNDEARRRLQDMGGRSSSEFEDMQRRMQELEEDLDEANRRLEEQARDEQGDQKLLDEVADLKHELQLVDDEKDRLEEALAQGLSAQDQEDMERELRRLRDRVQQHKEDQDSLSRELEVTKTRLASRDDEKAELLERLEQAAGRKEAEALRADADQLQAERDHAEAIVEKLEIELEEANAQNAELQRLVEEYGTQGPRGAGQLDKGDLERLHALERELDEKDAELAANNNDLKASSEQVWELEQQGEQLKIDKQKLVAELLNAEEQLSEATSIEKELNQRIKTLQGDYDDAITSLGMVEEERDQNRQLVDELSQSLADLEAKRREDNAARLQVLDERDDVESELRRARNAKADFDAARKDLEREADRLRRSLKEKEELNARLQQDLEHARKRLSQRDRDIEALETSLRDLEYDRRKVGDEHTSDRHGLELEIQSVKRELERSHEDAAEADDQLRSLEAELAEKEETIASLNLDIRDLESQLTAERQDKLSGADRLVLAQKASKRSEAEAESLRDRMQDLERRLQSDHRALSSSTRDTEAHRDEHDALLAVYHRVAKMVGATDEETPATTAAIKDKLASRLRALGQASGDADRKIKTVESALEQKLGSLNRELDSKKRLLDTMEASINKMSNTKLQWRTRLTMKEDELADAKARQRELQSEMASLKATSSVGGATEAKALSTRSSNAEKRVALLSNQLNSLEKQAKEQEARHASATSKWEARVAEFEKLLKQANERVKAEKQGGKERAQQLEQTVRGLQEQLKQTNVRNERLSSFLSAAKVTARADPDAL